MLSSGASVSWPTRRAFTSGACRDVSDCEAQISGLRIDLPRHRLDDSGSCWSVDSSLPYGAVPDDGQGPAHRGYVHNRANCLGRSGGEPVRSELNMFDTSVGCSAVLNQIRSPLPASTRSVEGCR